MSDSTNARKVLVDIEGLGLFLENLKTYITNNIDAELDINSLNAVQNKVITDRFEKSFWHGTTAEFQVALAEGKINEHTIIELEDDSDEPIIQPCSSTEVNNLFKK